MTIIGTVGYIANNPKTIVLGTNSVGRIYDQLDEYFFIRLVIFDGYLLIGQIENKPLEELEKEWKNLVR